MKNRLVRLVRNESGATAIEYGLIAGLVAVVLVTALALMGDSLNDTFTAITGSMPTTMP
ncbi:Flp family type IVb pilin (plasmid) [Paracoccus liaowanqingii]|uniref:Flp family type IVb pilin n=1 Tax=Paracoccus liaowanqingii TaxID=2560053 RepID=A0A4Y5SQB9_9RHOB|nr:Flp family type IVb pilin [Paracoccus liaowanqingii]QDA35687.1 Flp family type IVb pilin [Paracoccus liaowanqingii]